MVIGREGQLRLPPLGELAVLGDDPRHHVVLRVEERALVLLAEVAVPSLELRNARIGVDPDGIAPGEVEPDL